MSYRETALGLSLLALLVAGSTGCKVQVNKSGDGESDNVKVATPFGAIDINKDQTSPAEIGLPAYPGAALDTAGDGNKSARVDLGFGPWKLRVKAAHYITTDSKEKVLAFYRNALSGYGSVIECAGNKAVGSPVVTPEGLSCDQSSKDHSMPHDNFGSDDLELKAGSPRHQHIVVLHRGSSSETTHFSLIALDLPHISGNEQQGTN